MGSFLELLLVTSMPVLKFLLISALGLFLALKRVDVLGETARHHLNRIVFYVFGPALLSSYLAETITFKRFLTMWFMPINILLIYVIGSAFGWVLVKVSRAPKHSRGLVVAFCSAGNFVAMPIIIIPALCEQKGSPFGTADVCKQYGLAYASLSMAIGAIYTWSYIYNIMRICEEKEVDTKFDERDPHERQHEEVINVHDARPLSASNSAHVADMNPAVSINYLSNESYGATSVNGTKGFPSIQQPVGASTEPVSDSSKFAETTSRIKLLGQCFKDVSKKINLKSLLAPSTIAAGVGLFIGMISPLQKLLFGENAPLRVVGDTALLTADAAIPSVTLILGANMLKGMKGSRVSLTIIIGVMIVRYIFLPLLGIVIVKGALRAGMVHHNDLLLQFVLLMQYALPPGLSIGTIAQIFGASQMECAVIMLWTYVVAPVTFTLWITFYLWLVSA